MTVSIAALRSFGTRRVTVHSCDGSFDGSILANFLTEQSVVLLFAPHDAPQQPIVIDVAGIAEVVER